MLPLQAKHPPKGTTMEPCVICGNKYEGWGNNAAPVAEGKCCSFCNGMYVLPVRLAEMAARA